MLYRRNRIVIVYCSSQRVVVVEKSVERKRGTYFLISGQCADMVLRGADLKRIEMKIEETEKNECIPVFDNW